MHIHNILPTVSITPAMASDFKEDSKDTTIIPTGGSCSAHTHPAAIWGVWEPHRKLSAVWSRLRWIPEWGSVWLIGVITTNS